MKTEWVIKFEQPLKLDGIVVEAKNGNPSPKVLSGLKVGVKDLFHIADVPTAAGNPDWLRTHPLPQATSPVISSFLEAGAEIVGKTLTDELAYSLNGQNFHYGTPINYAAPDRLVGGSSSGSVAVVRSEEADIGLGTDTGGSIRVPASYNGVFGLRTTHGAILMAEMVPLAPSFDTVGWFARDLETMAKVSSVLLSEAESLKKAADYTLKVIKPVIVGSQIWSQSAEEWLQIVMPQFESVQEMALESSFFEKASETFRVLQGAEIWQTHGQWIEETSPEFAPDIQQRFEWCAALSENEIEIARAERKEIEQLLNQLLDADTIALIPTTPGAAPLSKAQPEELASYRNRLMGLTALAGLSGRPQLHLPVLEKDGAPWGLSMLGYPGSDRQLIEIAKQLASSMQETA